jgi:hypothetical protein
MKLFVWICWAFTFTASMVVMVTIHQGKHITVPMWFIIVFALISLLMSPRWGFGKEET